MKTNILAPIIKLEESVKFYVNGRVFEMTGSIIEEVETIEPSLRKAIQAFESFEFTTNSVKWYHGAVKFVYDLSEGVFMHNNMLIEGNTFTDHVLAAGTVRYGHKNVADLFESIPSLLQNFIVLDFAASFESKNVSIDLFKVNESIYVSKYNANTKMAKFYRAENANAALELVKEQTGQDATKFLAELLEGEAKELAEKAALIEKYEDMIAFLKDQRGLLAEADKSIEEIKAADSLISGEIKMWENKIFNVLNESKIVKDLAKEFAAFVPTEKVLPSLIQNIMASTETDKSKISYLKDEVGHFIHNKYYTEPPTQEYYDMMKLNGQVAKEYFNMNKKGLWRDQGSWYVNQWRDQSLGAKDCYYFSITPNYTQIRLRDKGTSVPLFCF